MDKNIIIRNFSRCAYVYDRYADIQKCIAIELLKLINPVHSIRESASKLRKGGVKEDNINNILEVGCGTGNYTLILREKFKNAKIKSIDISKEMIEVATQKLEGKKIEFIVGDGETIDLEERFDLITSNACFQWFQDLEAAFKKYKRLLKDNGLISFSIFGPETFWELNESLKRTLENISISVDNFISQPRLKRLLGNNFKDITLKETRYEESFSCLRELLNKIRYSGIRGYSFNGKFLFTTRLLNKIEDYYLARFNRIRASYQIFLCQVSMG
jgi:malonyl-CoA O-methyltransferase